MTSRPGDFDIDHAHAMIRRGDPPPTPWRPQITELDFRGSGIADLEPLTGLFNLKKLTVWYAEITDLSPLAGLTTLREVHLPYARRLSDLSPLTSLCNLEVFALCDAPVTEVWPLAALSKLEQLDLRWTQVADIGPLAGLLNLKWLMLERTPVTDIAPLANLVNLSELCLGHTRIADAQPLAELRGLRSLDLYGTQVSDLSPLAGLSRLERLTLHDTPVTDLSPLGGLEKLRSLYLQGTRVEDLGPVSHVKEVTAPDGRTISARTKSRGSAKQKRPSISSFDIQPAGSPIAPGQRRAEAVVSPFDFVIVDGQDAEASLARLRAEYPQATPVIFGSPANAADLLETVDDNADTPDAIIEQARALDLDAWFARRAVEPSSRGLPRHGVWPDAPLPTRELALLGDIGALHAEVVVGLLPCGDSAHAAAHLGFGGWNDCPDPAVHVALARRWAVSHGAVLVTQARDSLEFRVARPIASREEAMQMALAHYLYCYDTIEQGSATIEALAASLVGATVWSFWWD